MPIDYEPMSSNYWDDPYPIYRRLREEAPLHRGAETGILCLSRHADVVAALRQPEIFSSSAMGTILMSGGAKLGLRDLPALLRFSFRTRINPLKPPGPPPALINTDPPFHDALRNKVNRGFTPRRIDAWEPRIRALVKDLMSGLRSGVPFDVVRDLGIPLPVTVIAEMLGIEAERHVDFKRWSDTIVSFASGTLRGGGMTAMLDTIGECRTYVRRIVRARRSDPKDDLISVLVDPAGGEALDEEEIFCLINLILVAGNETTTNLIGNTTLALLDHPHILEAVRSDPSRIPDLLEETLRWNAPVQLVFRETRQDIELPSGKVPAGVTVVLLLASANRDERVFPDPDRFDLDRESRSHLSFGFGVHFCLGAALARLEARVALEALVPELPTRRRTEDKPALVDSFLVRGPRRLELVEQA